MKFNKVFLQMLLGYLFYLTFFTIIYHYIQKPSRDLVGIVINGLIGFCHLAKFENGEWGINLPVYLTFVFLGSVVALLLSCIYPYWDCFNEKRDGKEKY
jgi:hypothetical protein